ncbi:CRAL-TRIO domain-containing protein [Russula brevipes]|nr:CRAL-TRIO domain-containing protein [Russula brevipes]
MHEKVLEHFRSESYEMPGVQDDGRLMDEEKFWLWTSAKAAIERLEVTLKWRREFGIYDLTPEEVEPEAVTGKELVFGYDTHRRPALYMIPSRQNTEESPRQIQFAFWMLERALDLTGPGVESLVVMLNFADKAKNPSFATSKSVLNILQTHYPERLAAALILNVPFVIHLFFKMIGPFIDPVTRDKMKFNPKPIEDGLFAADELFKDGGWGGSRDFVWDHEKYWGPLMARWRKLGAHVGCDEWDYKSDGVVDVAHATAEGGVVVGDQAAEAGATAEVSAEAQAQARDQDQTEAPPTEPQTTDHGDPDVHAPEPGEAEAEADSEVVVSATAI